MKRMKKIFYLAITFAALSLNSCGSKGSSADNVGNDAPKCEAPEGELGCDGHGGRHRHGHKEGRPHRPMNPNDMIQHRVDRMSEELNLTDEQRQKVVDCLTQQAAKFDSMANKQREQMKAMHEEERETLKSILTPEQIAKLDSMKCDAHRREGCGPKDGKPKGPRPEGGKQEGRRHHHGGPERK